MLTGIHFLLTYSCTNECDHCFLHCSPRTQGTFTPAQLRRVFTEIRRIGAIGMVYFEGGEAFLHYPLLLNGLRLAARLGLPAGIVTNAYWATSFENALLWLKPIRDIGIAGLSISDDALHHATKETNPAKIALAAAAGLRIPCDTICVDPARGSVRFRGRAAERLTAGLPRRPCARLDTCPHEQLESPERLHVDCYGHVHICQGLIMGNMWRTPLSRLVRDYNPHRHPICGPLLDGGPAALARQYGVRLPDDFVDECHYCYAVRKALVARFPRYLAPTQVYAL